MLYNYITYYTQNNSIKCYFIIVIEFILIIYLFFTTKNRRVVYKLLLQTIVHKVSISFDSMHN